MRTKEERRNLHRSQLVTKDSLTTDINNSAHRDAYVTGPSGIYKNIKVQGSDFYVKLNTHKE